MSTIDNCGHDGGVGIGAGHRCRCVRPDGHPADSDRPHGCECGAVWADDLNVKEERPGRAMPAPSPDPQGLVDWIVYELGYPFDMSTDPPIPEPWCQAIAEAWWRRENLRPDGTPYENAETIDDVYKVCAEEGGWS